MAADDDSFRKKLSMGDRQHAEGSFITQATGESAFAMSLQIGNFPQIEDLPDEISNPLLRFLQSATTPPRFTDLFEVVRDPAEVAPAIFRSKEGHSLQAYDVPYAKARGNVDGTCQHLRDQLFDSGGSLLLTSRAGLGKTRELTELAAMLCDSERWVVCVAQGGDASRRLRPPSNIPDELLSERLLFVFDNLHRRALGSVSNVSYLDRLESFLSYCDRVVGPGNVFALSTARSEPHYQNEIDYSSDHPVWQRFARHELSEFNDSQLQDLLLSLASGAEMSVSRATIEYLVSNSDRTPHTFLLNVERCRQANVAINRKNWQPTRGQSWEARFREVRGSHPATSKVYQSLHLVREAGLPTRSSYVTALAGTLSKIESPPAIDALVNRGLVGLRNGILDLWGDEQLEDSFRATNESLPDLEDHIEILVELVASFQESAPNLANDLDGFTSTLVELDRAERAEDLCDKVIRSGYTDPAVYHARGRVRFHQGKFAEAEDDHTAAIEKEGSVFPVAYLSRGLVRIMQEKYAQGEEDCAAAIKQGFDEGVAYFLRGVAREHDNFAEAEADFSKALEKGYDEAGVYFLRGRVRGKQERYAEAEEDLNKAIDRNRNMVESYALRGDLRVRQKKFGEAETDFTAAIERGSDNSGIYYKRGEVLSALKRYAEAESDFDKAIKRGLEDPEIYILRGLTRAMQNKHAAAETDLTIAVDKGLEDPALYLRGLIRGSLGERAAEEKDYTAAIEKGYGNAGVYKSRAMARLQQDNLTGGEADYTTAIEQGCDDTEAYYNRGVTRIFQGKYAEASEDFDTVINQDYDEPAAYYFRGRASAGLEKVAEAEDYYTKAIERGCDVAEVYFYRGLIYSSQQKSEEAEEDYTTAIGHGYDDPQIYFLRGIARQERAAEAEADCTKAIELGYDEIAVYWMRGITRGRQGKYAEAETDYTNIIGREESAQAYRLRGRVRLFQQKLEEAESDFTTAIDQEASRVEEVHYDRLKTRLYKLDFQAARKDAKRIARLSPDSCVRHAAQGMINLADQMPNLARTRFTEAINSSPERMAYHFLLGLSLLLSGDPGKATAAYTDAIADSSSPDVTGLHTIALRDLNFWTKQQMSQVQSPEARDAIREIANLFQG